MWKAFQAARRYSVFLVVALELLDGIGTAMRKDGSIGRADRKALLERWNELIKAMQHAKRV